MRKLYVKLAAVNIRNNRQLYLPYLLAGVFSAAMFYLVMSIQDNPGLEQMRGGAYVAVTLLLGVIIVGLFAAIFLFYTNSFIMKRRKRELSVYNILGMEKKHIARVLFLEMLFTAAVTIGGGLLFGIAFGKLMTMLLYRMTGFNQSVPFTISLTGCHHTLVLFGCIYAVTLFYNFMQIKLSNPMELLHSANAGEREPKTKVLLALIGAAALGGGYYLALTVADAVSAITMFFVAVLLVILGTYCLFTAGSIAVLKLLRKNKNYYYKSRHFTTVSGMIYRMKQNAVGLANICIEYATKRYRSNCVNWGILPFTNPDKEIVLEPGEYVYLPGIRKAVEEGATKVTATVIGTDGSTRPMELELKNVTEAEKKVLLAGSLINFYKEEK